MISIRIIFFNIFESLIYPIGIISPTRAENFSVRNARFASRVTKILPELSPSVPSRTGLFAFRSNPRDTFIHIRHFEFASSLHPPCVHWTEATSNYFPTDASLHFISQIYSVIWTEFNDLSSCPPKHV